MSMKKLGILIFLFVFLLSLVSGNVFAQDSIVVGVDAPPRTMDPYGSDADSNLSVMSNLFDGLLQRNTAGDLLPALATSWDRIDDFTWRFTLREGVKFHNGNDFTWEDVKFSMERLANPEVSEFLSFGGNIVSVETVDGDPWVIDITTEVATPFFAENLHQIFIMDKDSTEARDQGQIGTEPIGTGAYRLDEWVRGSYLRMSANPDYWEGTPSIANAEYRPISEASTRLASISGGTLDILQGVPVTFIEQVRNNDNIELVTRPGRRSIFLPMTSDEDSPLSNIKVRQAIYMAIDIDEIVEQVMFGQASPAAQIPDPPTLGYSDEIERLPYNPERARELLAEAGYPDGFDLKFDGPNNRYVQDEEIMQAVAGYLERIGINVEVDAKPMSIFFEEVANKELDFYLIGWFDGSYDYGRTFTQLLHSIEPDRGLGGLNGARYSDDVLDSLYDVATKIINPDIRGANLRVLNRLAMSPEKLAVIPLHYQVDSYATYKGRGINFTPRSDTWIVFKEMSYDN